jgi:type I restriction enzyme S subunit
MATRASKLIDHLDKATLDKAFRGELVPQDPADEQASKLLEHIRAERRSSGAQQSNRGRRIRGSSSDQIERSSI